MQSDDQSSEQKPVWELNSAEAHELLSAFVRIGQEGVEDWARDRDDLDFSESSVIGLLQGTLEDLQSGSLNEEQTNVRFGRLGYYFGEALIRAKPGLYWSSGNTDFAFANQPVVAGFVGGKEAPTITICRNLVEAILKNLSPPSRIERGVRNWFASNAA